ncbi:MAG TPA: PhoPQ-activated protein PqaA family protein, partial [Bacillota bacterium]|nr:PhoPQ-activated protein PqaA family protein [Bacillota bacterium]
PMVIDMLNMKAQTQWAAKMYGRQSQQIEDYTDYHLTERMDEPRMVELRSWVDPYSYRERYTLPKLLLLGTNDPYWVVDSLRHYWNELPEPKLVFQTPNAGHDLAGGRDAKPTLAAFFQMITAHQPLPRMTWKFEPGSTNAAGIEVNVQPPAKAFRLWTATSIDRDFRNDNWSSVPLPSNPGTHAVGTVEKPEAGFRAYLVEAEFTTPSGLTYKLSTEARVTPDGPPARPQQAVR